MIYTTKYFSQKADINVRTFSTTLDKAILAESKAQNQFRNFTGDQFDIFLSHSYLDKKIIYGIYLELEELGFSVYVDWIKDPELDRTNITSRNAIKIRQRLCESKCLFYATTNNSKRSTWMPWELGFMDGKNQKVAILPMTDDNEQFQRNEYLEIYPYIEKVSKIGSKNGILRVCENDDKFNSFDNWLAGENLKKRNS